MKKPIMFGYVKTLRGIAPQKWDGDIPQHMPIAQRCALPDDQAALTLDELVRLYPFTGNNNAFD